MLSNTWYNFHISHQPLYLPKWHKKGIHLIGDIVKTNGELFTFQEIKSIHNLNDNVFYYNRVRLCVNKFLKNMKKVGIFTFQRPPLPLHLKTLVTTKQGCQGFYKFLSENLARTAFPTVSQNGENYSEIITLTPFGIIYKACFKTTTDTAIIGLQYKVLYNILGTRNLLNKMKIKDSNLCVFCKKFPETIEHLFCECLEICELWKNLENWILIKIGTSIKFTDDVKILGYYQHDQNYWPINLILLTTKRYIFWCSQKNFRPSIYLLQTEIKKSFTKQKHLYEINSNISTFNKKLGIWINIF